MRPLVIAVPFCLLLSSTANAIPPDCDKYKGYKPTYCEKTVLPPKAKRKAPKEWYQKLPPRYPRYQQPRRQQEDGIFDYLLNPFKILGDSGEGPMMETASGPGPLDTLGQFISDPIGSSKSFNPLDD